MTATTIIDEKTAHLLHLLGVEVKRQDEIHPAGYPATRDGLRLALATIMDEHDEAYDEWRANRRIPDVWGALDVELLQVAAVAVRAVRSMYDAAEQGRRSPGGS